MQKKLLISATTTTFFSMENCRSQKEEANEEKKIEMKMKRKFFKV